MGTQVTFTTDFTPEGLAELQRELAALTGGTHAGSDATSPEPATAPGIDLPSDAPGKDPDENVERMARELRDSIGPNNQALVMQMTSYGEAEFTMPDVARDLGVAEPTVQARFRNLCKVLNRLQDKYGTATPWPAEQRAGRWHFTATPAWREAVARAWR